MLLCVCKIIIWRINTKAENKKLKNKTAFRSGYRKHIAYNLKLGFGCLEMQSNVLTKRIIDKTTVQFIFFSLIVSFIINNFDLDSSN